MSQRSMLVLVFVSVLLLTARPARAFEQPAVQDTARSRKELEAACCFRSNVHSAIIQQPSQPGAYA